MVKKDIFLLLSFLYFRCGYIARALQKIEKKRDILGKKNADIYIETRAQIAFVSPKCNTVENSVPKQHFYFFLLFFPSIFNAIYLCVAEKKGNEQQFLKE